VATNQAGVGYGAIGMDSSFNVSVGSSSPAGIARFVVNASSGASTYTLKALSSTGASLFSVDNSGNVVTAGSLTAGSFVGNLSGTDAAGNISSGAFGANTGGGNYSFPASVGIGTASPASQLMVYGSAGTGAPVTGGGTLLVGDSALGSTNAGGAVLFGGGNSSGQYFAGIKGALQNGSGNASGNLNFYTRVNATDGSLTQQMTILSSGNVGIGTTGPGYKLDVEGGQVNASGGFCIAGSCIASWPTGNVTSVFGRTGAVTAASGDYTVAQVTGAAPLASPTFTGSVTIVNGSLGVGMSSVPNGQMSIAGSNTTGVGPALWLYNTTGAYNVGAAAEIAFSTDGSTDNTPNASIMVVQNGISGASADTVFDNWNGGTNVETMRIRSNGNVGIGTTAPAQILSVAGTIQSTSGGIMFPDGTTQTTAASGSSVVGAGNVSAGTFGANTGGGNYSFSGGVTVGSSGYISQAGDIGVSRNGSPTTGVIYLGSGGSHYLYFDGTNYNLNAGGLNVTGAISGSSFSGSGSGLTGTAASLTSGALQYLGPQTANTSGSLTSGLTVGGVYTNGYPTSYGNVLNIGGGGYGQLLIGWSGSTGGTADNYIRSLRDSAVGTNNWSTWAKIITDQNYNSYAPTLTGGGANGTWGINITGTAQNANQLIGKNWNWSGQSGQPSWLWGGSDGTNMYVYNPSNFSVNYANSAGSLSNNNISQFNNDSGYITSAASGFSHSLYTNGYDVLPDGLIIEWGVVTPGGCVSFSKTFPNAIFSATAATYGGTDRITYVSSYSTGSICISNNGSGVSATYMAIGD
jgi:hypothetical protein